MKVLAVAGSPRRGGNSDTLLEQAISGAQSSGATVELVLLSQLNIRPCAGCERCFVDGRCVVNDDYQMLYDKVLEADALILASPIYFTSVSGWAKSFVDRFQCLWALRHVLKRPVPLPAGGKRRRAMFLAAAGSPHLHFDCALSVVRAMFSAIDAVWVGSVCVNNIDQRGAVAERPEILQQARELGARLVGPIGES
ncbi:MAG TPA: flavodoxin family protein [Anaerolineae bacterium]|nr:flavodoxin family protein [Anaerolineae bacterium]HQJ50490.1 flavodoxin family protein [Anaerolineae bacterium]